MYGKTTRNIVKRIKEKSSVHLMMEGIETL